MADWLPGGLTIAIIILAVAVLALARNQIRLTKRLQDIESKLGLHDPNLIR